MNNELTTILMEYGFSQQEASIYLTLLEIGRGSIDSIHRILGVDIETIRHCVQRMSTLQYIFCLPKDGIDEYISISPQDLLIRRKEAGEKLAQFSMTPHDLSLYHYPCEKPLLGNEFTISYYEGVSGLQKYYQQHIVEGKTIYGIIAPDAIHPILLDYLYEHNVPERVENKIYVYAIVDNTQNHQKEKYINHNTCANRESICIDDHDFTISAGINIFGDNSIGIVLYAYDEMCALTIPTKNLYTTLKSLFLIIRENHHSHSSSRTEQI